MQQMMQQLLQQSSIAPEQNSNSSEQNSNSSSGISGITTSSHGQTTTQTTPCTVTTAITQDNVSQPSMTSATKLPLVGPDFWNLDDPRQNAKTLAKHAQHGAKTLLDVFSTEDYGHLHTMLEPLIPDYAERYPNIAYSLDRNARRQWAEIPLRVIDRRLLLPGRHSILSIAHWHPPQTRADAPLAPNPLGLRHEKPRVELIQLMHRSQGQISEPT